MNKLILAGIASLFALTAHAAPEGKWNLLDHQDGKDTYIDIGSGIVTDSTIVHHDVLVWYDFKTSVEIVDYDVDCPHGKMRKTAMATYNDLTKAWPESPYSLNPSVGKWLHPYDHATKEVFYMVCIGGE
jgi:hypothetical protein